MTSSTSFTAASCAFFCSPSGSSSTGFRRRCDSRTISGSPPFSVLNMVMSSGGRPTRSDQSALPSTVCVSSGSVAIVVTWV